MHVCQCLIFNLQVVVFNELVHWFPSSQLSRCILEAAKKTDRAFRVTPQSTSHTVRGTQIDIQRMVKHLLERETTAYVEGRESPAFTDPTETGLQKLSTTSWLSDRLLAGNLYEDVEEEDMDGEVDLEYELADVV